MVRKVLLRFRSNACACVCVWVREREEGSQKRGREEEGGRERRSRSRVEVEKKNSRLSHFSSLILPYPPEAKPFYLLKSALFLFFRDSLDLSLSSHAAPCGSSRARGEDRRRMPTVVVGGDADFSLAPLVV